MKKNYCYLILLLVGIVNLIRIKFHHFPYIIIMWLVLAFVTVKMINNGVSNHKVINSEVDNH